MAKITVVDYDPTWPTAFEAVRARVWQVVGDIAIAVEHVGSTSVPGLPAKPVIDIDVVVPTGAAVTVAIERLSTLGYRHLADLGIEGREAFAGPNMPPRHHLYGVQRTASRSRTISSSASTCAHVQRPRPSTARSSVGLQSSSLRTSTATRKASRPRFLAFFGQLDCHRLKWRRSSESIHGRSDSSRSTGRREGSKRRGIGG